MTLRDLKAYVKTLNFNSKALNQGRKTKPLLAITIALILTLSIMLTIPTTTTNNDNNPITNIRINNNKDSYPIEKQHTWNYSISGGCSSVSMSSDGNYIATGSLAISPDNKVYFFNRTGDLLWSYITIDEIWSVAVSSDGNYIAAGVGGFFSGKVYFFNKTGDLLWDYHTGDEVHSVAVSSDGNYTAAGSIDDRVYFFNRSGNLWYYKTNGRIYSVAVSSDGSYIAAGSLDDKVYFFNRSGYLWNQTIGRDVYSVAVSSDGNYIAAAMGGYYYLYFFDRTGSLLWHSEFWTTYNSVDVSFDGHRIAASGDQVYFFELLPPSIDHPDDITYEFGTTGNNIIWHPVDDNPSYYDITRNGTVEDSGPWSGGNISKIVDGMSLGNHVFICSVYDQSGNSVSDTVMVTVIEAEEEGFPWLFAGVGAVVAAAGIGATVLYFKKRKK